MHICSVTYVKYVYSTPLLNGCASDFICGIYMYIYLLYMCVKYLAYLAYMPNLMDIFVSGIYLVIICVVEVAFSCVLVYVCIMVALFAHKACCPVSTVWNVAAIFVQ